MQNCLITDDVESTDPIIVSAVGAALESACPANTALYPWLRKWHERGVSDTGSVSVSVRPRTSLSPDVRHIGEPPGDTSDPDPNPGSAGVA